jgi:hypothetical protein
VDNGDCDEDWLINAFPKGRTFVKSILKEPRESLDDCPQGYSTTPKLSWITKYDYNNKDEDNDKYEDNGVENNCEDEKEDKAGRNYDQEPKNITNIILFLWDDLDYINTPVWDVMPFAKKYIYEQGVSFTRTISPSSICCAARCQILTGLYPHNVGVSTNSGKYGGFQAFTHPYDISGERIVDEKKMENVLTMKIVLFHYIFKMQELKLVFLESI